MGIVFGTKAQSATAELIGRVRRGAVYSFAVLMYELYVGHPAYEGYISSQVCTRPLTCTLVT